MSVVAMLGREWGECIWTAPDLVPAALVKHALELLQVFAPPMPIEELRDLLALPRSLR